MGRGGRVLASAQPRRRKRFVTPREGRRATGNKWNGVIRDEKVEYDAPLLSFLCLYARLKLHRAEEVFCLPHHHQPRSSERLLNKAAAAAAAAAARGRRRANLREEGGGRGA